MKTKQFNKLIKLIEEINNTEIDIVYFLESYGPEDINSFEDIYQAIEEGGGFNIEIIYYSKAMDYLMDNDTSLNESLSLASDMGYTPENLNSEILASILASENSRTEFYELESEITEFFDNL